MFIRGRYGDRGCSLSIQFPEKIAAEDPGRARRSVEERAMHVWVQSHEKRTQQKKRASACMRMGNSGQ
jgi:hypothetical protein